MKKALLILFAAVILLAFRALPVLASGATTSIHIVKYDSQGKVVTEVTRDYKWLEANLPVTGNGVTHYFHQGPIFEGDMWDAAETENLKDKGAVKGTSLKDLCGLVGGMSPGDEIMVRAVDGWHTEFAYENIYQPPDVQGVISLCWYCGEDAFSGERYGKGYPGAGSYYTAMQIVFITDIPNADGKFVFGNTDMKIALPDEKYQHFYEGLPSTNGLSGKWISEVAIFTGEAPVEPGEKLPPISAIPEDSEFPVVPLVLGVVGLAIITVSILFLVKRKAG